MDEYFLVGISSVIALGISAQWLAWRTKLPAILLLLVFGIIAGPVTGWINPDELLGDILSPFVSISVAIILFEGGLSLRMAEFRKIGGVVIKLMTIGLIITWSLAAIAAYYLLGLSIEIAVLFGAILIVTGPTVIIPLLRQVRPTENTGSILKWEGIVNDPIGAMMAVLVYEILLTGGFTNMDASSVLVIATTIIDGSFIGALGAGILYIMLKKHWIPEYLQNPITLMIVIASFTISNLLQHESGLLAVTIMGILLANQKSAKVKHIIEFKENLQVLLISALFILLASRLQISDLAYFNFQSGLFILALLVVVRPVSIYAATWGSNLTLQEKTFLAWMAPRGIVAAAISAIFALRLEQEGFADAEKLVPYTFVVIIATVTVYGLSANPVARLLKVAKPQPNGVLFLGAHSWSLDLACQLQELGLKVMVADSNWENISKARKRNLETYHGNILSEFAMDEINFDGIGKLFALTQNDEVNALASIRFAEIFGSSNVFQLPQSALSIHKESETTEALGGRILFSNEWNHSAIEDFMSNPNQLALYRITDGFNLKNFTKKLGKNGLIVAVLNGQDNLLANSLDNPPTTQLGDLIVIFHNTVIDLRDDLGLIPYSMQQEPTI
ncbi:sodium:proton antiporter [Balneolaceae bacterium]|jgi:NhaP-type Na+/H+ or K+/H+ antiporter|nr:sodium:proton antiporter [Balneolaceae bacterium]CAI8312593.1 MAG: K(+)/H(+) antiporter NhaP [Rhodothermaeota bacterium MED-G12]|tara:strand:+ start:1627 stop:3477 length:1851 start_codon:yes stop_codon:yes gene_type:complete